MLWLIFVGSYSYFQHFWGFFPFGMAVKHGSDSGATNIGYFRPYPAVSHNGKVSQVRDPVHCMLLIGCVFFGWRPSLGWHKESHKDADSFRGPLF